MKSNNVTQLLALLSTLATAAIFNHELKPRFIGIDENGAHLYETYQIVHGTGGVPSRFYPSSNKSEDGSIDAALRTPRGVLNVLRNKRAECQRGSKKCDGADKCCDGEICCEYGYCLDKARICCPKGGCDAGKLCCGQSNCSPSDGACCRDESSCQKGNECVQFGGAGIMCCSDKKCTAHVENGKTISAPSSTATSTSTSKPGETVTEGSAAGATTTAAGGNARGSSTTSSSGPRKTSSTVTDPGSSSADDDQSHNNNGGTALGSTDSGPNIGAIVGGVVGAVGGIALIALIIVCVLRRNKRTMEEINSQHQRGSQYQGSMAPRSVVSGHGQASLRSARSPVSPVTGGFSPRSQFDKYSPSPLGGASSPTQDWNALSARSVGASMGMSVLGSPAPSQLAQSQHAVSLRDTMTVASTSVRAASISAMPSIGPGGKPQTEICEAPTHIAELRRGPIHEAPTDMSDSHRGEMQEME